MADYFKISRERLKGFADQARRLGEVTGELTPEQIEDTLSGVEAGGIPENARLYYVGNAISETALRIESEIVATGIVE